MLKFDLQQQSIEISARYSKGRFKQKNTSKRRSHNQPSILITEIRWTRESREKETIYFDLHEIEQNRQAEQSASIKSSSNEIEKSKLPAAIVEHLSDSQRFLEESKQRGNDGD